jgi:hypothetical protein
MLAVDAECSVGVDVVNGVDVVAGVNGVNGVGDMNVAGRNISHQQVTGGYGNQLLGVWSRL